MSTENHTLYISKQDLPHFLVVRMLIEYVNIDVISLEVARGLRIATVYDLKGTVVSIFDYICSYPPGMKVRLR